MRGRSKKKYYCLLVGFSSLVVVYIAATVTIGWYGLQNAEEEFMDRLFLGDSSGSSGGDSSSSSGSGSGSVPRTAKQSGSASPQSLQAQHEHPPIAQFIAQQDKVQQILRQTQQRSFLPLQAITEDSSHILANPTNRYQYPKPLPLRTQPRLQTFTYFQSVQTCRDLPNGWPVDHDLHQDAIYSPMVGDDMKSLFDQRQDYAPICPVDLDPFLPWIHDVVPNRNGTHITILAHNKRRCRQDPQHFRADQDNLEPQVALLQSVSVRRVSPNQLQELSNHHHNIPNEWKSTTAGARYQLAPIDKADEDAKETRFICQFHMLTPTNTGDTVQKVVVGETFSQFPYNYEHANLMHRKGQKPNPMLTRASSSNDVNGLHNEQIWNAILEFSCPVPKHLQDLVRQSHDNIIPIIYMDIVPIRTPPREDRVGYNPWHLKRTNFSPLDEWGAHPILPPLEQSGRWQNVPICPASSANQNHPSSTSQAVTTTKKAAPPPHESSNQKENYLVGCLWASAAFSTRGENRLDTSTQDRLLEWLTYHLDVAGFDKMIIYDNTEAFTNETSLQPVVDLFDTDKIVRIPWKHRVCNNNRPTHPNQGERSSQYAAEASCRIRYGPTTEWMISFDTDEYLIPQGDYTSMKNWLQDSVANGSIGQDTHVLDFYQIRGMLNHRFTERFLDGGVCLANHKASHCLTKRSNATFMESFCEAVQFPKPEFTGRAKKQLYRPSFVLNHFVHYAAVTRLINEKPKMHRVVGYPYERRVVELTEAFLLHTKTTPTKSTREWKKLCKEPKDSCRVGFPWPFWQEDNKTLIEETTGIEVATNNDEGYAYNCYENRKVHTVMAGLLRVALQPYLQRWRPQIVSQGSMGKIEAHPDAQAIKATPEVSPEAAAPIVGHGDIPDFQPGRVPAVIATKIQGNSTLIQLEQALCLLKYAYNDRVQYDIVVFAATPITAEETARLQTAAAPANLQVHMDNPGLETMIQSLRPDQLEYLVKRCNVTDASQLTWKTKCEETNSWGRTTNTPIQYAWQAEFRSLHLWNHPAIAKYKYMMWFDSDAFCTKKWQQDPIAIAARNELAILFDHFPQGFAQGSEWGQLFYDAFGKMICKVHLKDGHLVTQSDGCRLGSKLQVKQIHGFFHITNLDFYRSEASMKWFRIMVGDTKFSRFFDDQIGVTMPAAALAPNASWDMRSNGIHLGVLHSYKLDGQDQFGGYLKYWKEHGATEFPEAHGNCKITQHG